MSRQFELSESSTTSGPEPSVAIEALEGRLLLASGAGSAAVNLPPVITGLVVSPNPIPPDGHARLTALGVNDPDGFVRQVVFYQETNGIPGLQRSGGVNADL